MRKRVIPSWDQFSAPEIEESCNMPTRAMEQLKRENLVPHAVTSGGRGRAALYDFNAFAYFVCVSALLKVVPSLTVAGRLADAIIRELASIYGQVPFGLNEFDRVLYQKTGSISDLIGPNDTIMPLAVMNRLTGEPEIYQRGRVEKFDYRLLIINGRYVLSTTHGDIPIMNGVQIDGVWWQPELVLATIKRGSDVTVTRLEEYLDGNIERIVDDFSKAGDSIETRVELNISLPIRNALHALLEGRLGGT